MEKFFSTLGGKKVAFIGGGVAHRDLLVMFAKAGAKVTLCDKRSLADFGAFGDELLGLGVRLSLGENYLNGLEGQELILRTPGFEFYTPELQAAGKEGTEITSEIELFFEYCACPIIGVTGSDGKTTTTSLIAAICEKAGKTVHLGGNIGRSMLPIVDGIKPEDIAVVELSSFQLISMHHSPQTAVVTNVAPNHLDHHRDMDEYVNAKRNILLFQNRENSVAVLGLENERTRGMEKDAPGQVRWFSRLRKVQNGAFLADDGKLCLAVNGDTLPVIHKNEVALRGEHNIENLLAAFAALSKEAPTEAMAEVARNFSGVEHRIEPVRTLDGVDWYNDSIATSPTRVIAALKSFDQKLIVIAGGYDKNIPFEPLAEEAPGHIKLLILTGPAARKIETAVRKAPGYEENEPAILRAETMEEAVKAARENAQKGDIVILSPACASFDAYPNFEARGVHFKDLVNRL
ncbi:UDP-N-acetylmuramoyl-L-alanine--D-glutamate ligase [Ruminococcaceae bacterium OttesenSCG-928-I18]|nr:UDP-N-acetylmuramoyl-L-alanine--D-glutamate ligase [Ruminococcaceae bacterium OttesenSCG-928-I18]